MLVWTTVARLLRKGVHCHLQSRDVDKQRNWESAAPFAKIDRDENIGVS